MKLFFSQSLMRGGDVMFRIKRRVLVAYQRMMCCILLAFTIVIFFELCREGRERMNDLYR